MKSYCLLIDPFCRQLLLISLLRIRSILACRWLLCSYVPTSDIQMSGVTFFSWLCKDHEKCRLTGNASFQTLKGLNGSTASCGSMGRCGDSGGRTPTTLISADDRADARSG